METRTYRIVPNRPPKSIARQKLLDLIEDNGWSKVEVLFAANGEPDRIVAMVGDLGFMDVNYYISVYELRPGRFLAKDRMVLVSTQLFADERAKAENWFSTVASAYRKLHANPSPVVAAN